MEKSGARLEGRNAVLEALQGGRRIRRILIAKGLKPSPSLNLILKLAGERKVRISYVERASLDGLSRTRSHQGILAEAEPLAFVSLSELLGSTTQRGEPPFLLILDGITDPQNFGSLIRSAEGIGVDGVIFSRRRSAPVTAAVAKASAGALEHIPLVQVSNIAATIEELKKKGIWVVGASDKGEKDCFEADLTGSIALVLGSEGKGLSHLVAESCDFIVRIPMFGKISSLNVGVAGGILMYEVRRQRVKMKHSQESRVKSQEGRP